MRSYFSVCLFLLCLTGQSQAKEFKFTPDAAWQTVKSDYQSFYTSERLWRAAKVYSVGAVIAHTNIDTEFQQWHRDNVVSGTSKDVAKIAKLFGEKSILVPLSLVAASMQIADESSKTGAWGERTMRAYLVGGPAMYAVQLLTGGSRPKDEYQDAKWRPFNDNNGVSGHSFVGAVPFITLAQTEGLAPWQKNVAYFASTLSAWSRVHDDAHYLSQALLGWYMAWESVNSVSKNDTGSWYQFHPYAFYDGLGMGVTVSW